MPHFVDSRINENVEVATEYFKALVSSNQKDAENKQKQSAGSIGFIPYNISFTMDGISGIKIYNELSLDTNFLPAGYSKTTDFIVTGVDHKIQNGDWETSINVTLIPRTSPINNTITSSLSFTSADAAGFGMLRKGQQPAGPQVMNDPETGKTFEVDPVIAKAMTRDYSALMTAIDKKPVSANRTLDDFTRIRNVWLFALDKCPNNLA